MISMQFASTILIPAYALNFHLKLLSRDQVRISLKHRLRRPPSEVWPVGLPMRAYFLPAPLF